MHRSDVVIAIPTKEASSGLLPLLKDLKRNGYQHIVIVDDGCDKSRGWIFEEARTNYECDIIHHVIHLGKGRSLKNAFNYILRHYSDKAGIITVDDAGRHCIEEVNRCVEVMNAYPDDLILGCRDFKNKEFSKLSRLANKLSRKLIKILTGIDVADAMTGLRGMNMELAKRMLTVEGEQLDYEINMLLESKEKNISIQDFPITVEYQGQELSSSYTPLTYSIKPYLVFMKYTITSIVATVFDFLIFSTAVASLKWVIPVYYIIVSTIIARVCSSLINFYLSKNAVFKNDESAAPMMVRFFSLAGIQMILSAVLVTLIYRVLPITETVVKIIVDSALFVTFYPMQREWVFSNGNDKKNTEDNKSS